MNKEIRGSDQPSLYEAQNNRPTSLIQPAITLLYKEVSAGVSGFLALAAGLIYALSIFDWDFISGTGPSWDFLQGWESDRAQALIAWRYFYQDEWRFPLFNVPSLGYPEGINIVFTDSIPLVAAIFKMVYKVTRWPFNYFGLWIFFCYVLQAVGASFLLHTLGVRAWLVNLSGTLIALCAWILLGRFGHGALCGHFIILLSLGCYFSLTRNPDQYSTWMALIAASTLSVLVSAYFTPMIATILVATVVELFRKGQLPLGKGTAILAGSLVLLLAFMALGGMIGSEAPSPESSGFGMYSMNLLAPFFGDDTSFMQRWIGWVSWDATGGQYEGANYLGVGTLGLAALFIVKGRGHFHRSVLKHPALALAMILLVTYSLSNRIFFGHFIVLEYTLPDFAMKAGNTFRASGRMFWPVYYVVTLGLVAWTYRKFGQRAGLIIVIVAAAAQYHESGPLRNSVAGRARRVDQPPLMDADTTGLVTQAGTLFFFPSFLCTDDDPGWPSRKSWRAITLETMLVASRSAIPSNSMYSNRGQKDCALEHRTVLSKALEPGTLYVLRPSSALYRLATTRDHEHCRIKDSAVLCGDLVTGHPDGLQIDKFLAAYRIGEWILLSENPKAAPVLFGPGWSVPDQQGPQAATDGSEVGLVLRLDRVPTEDLVLRISAFAFPLLFEKSGEFGAAILANDRMVGRLTLRRGEPATESRIDIPRDIIRNGRPTKAGIMLHLVIRPDRPLSPQDLGLSQALRNLGFAVDSLCLAPRQQPCMEAPAAWPRFGDIVRFDRGGNSAAFRGRGWSEPEAWGIWTEGAEAQLEFRLNQEIASDLRLIADAYGFVHPAHPQQTIDIVVNGTRVAKWVFRLSETSGAREAGIPRSLIGADRMVRISFVVASPKSPQSVGLSNDKRMLGMAISNMKLEASDGP